ncbi:hypothetical protein, conserved [Plasmodium gonderi]|uniref:Uncharacterized protein n=1 Tax=Plasmodium gonderi TaxID=77519 RepID=A0A1Y1JEY1_PLAGO|nr:hypothetical protein, conserved [Plasmodium gonderi]GAW79767.1 hypothetical protein, conserved [Plasmodium gonderi]
MRTVLFNGPFIPEIDVGYNVQVNGVSINFLKDPFCFRDKMIKSAVCKKIENEPNEELLPYDENEEIMNPTISMEATELQRCIYEDGGEIEDDMTHKNSLSHKPVYGLSYGAIYKSNGVMNPHNYNKKIKYIQSNREIEITHKIPKLDINSIHNQEELIILHRCNI